MGGTKMDVNTKVASRKLGPVKITLYVLLAIVLMCAMFAAGIAIGAAAGGGEAGTAVVGSLARGLFAAAMVGGGVAVGGLWRTSLAAEVTALVVVATYLVDLLAPPLGWECHET